MAPPAKPSITGKPGYGDYVAEAFNLRVKVPGLGGLPLNWLYLAAVAGLSIPAWPMALVGAAGEIAYLATMAGSQRFRRTVQSRWQQRRGDDVETNVEHLVGLLPTPYRARYDAFQQKCEEVLQIADQVSPSGDVALTTYTTYLAQLRGVYARMLSMVATFARYSADWSKTDPAPQIAAIEKELAGTGLSEAVRTSRTGTLEVLKQRQTSRKDIAERVEVMRSEIDRLEQRLSLLRDQALLTKDPSALSTSMDEAAGILEEHTSWLQDNSALLQGMDEATTA
jgi:hypothetical protein